MRLSHRLVEVRYIATTLRRGRVGIIVPRFSQTAADRNRVKRRLREIIRRDLLGALPALDVTLRASPRAYGASFEELREAVALAATRLLATGP